MKIIKPSVEILEQGPGLEGIYKQIEQAGRNCYQSSHLIGEDTAKPFVERMVKDGHTAMLEHGAVYLQMPYSKVAYDAFDHNPYSKVSTIMEAGSMFVSTNYRVIIEHHLEDLLKYLVEPQAMHELRVTARFSTQIAISREYNRHRVNSIAEESTRYCNYSKDKYDNEIKINLPTWIDLSKHRELAIDGYICELHEGLERTWDVIDWWLFANTACEMTYMKLIELGWAAQQARTILPLDTNTVLVHTAFVSDWQHFFDLRSRGTTGKPHPDAKVLADELLKQFIEKGYMKCD